MTAPDSTKLNTAPRSDNQQLPELRDLFLSLTSISSVSRLSELMPRLAELVATSIGASKSSVFLFDPDSGRITNLQRWGFNPDELALLATLTVPECPRSNPALREVITTRRPLVRIPGRTPPRLEPPKGAWRDLQWRGDLLVPLLWRDRIEGIASVELPDDAGDFDPLQVEIAQSVAEQAASVINHLRTIERERQTRRHTEALLDLSRRFSSANTIEEIYISLAEAVREMMDTDAVSVVVHEPSPAMPGQSVIRRAVALGLTDAEKSVRDQILSERARLDSSVDREATRAHGPIILHDISEKVDDPRLREDYAAHGVTDLLAVPITISGALHGVLYSWSRNRSIPVDPERLRIAGTMAGHAGAYIERLVLVDAERKQRQRAEMLLSFAGALNRSLDLPTVTTTILDLLRTRLPSMDVVIAIREGGDEPGWTMQPGARIPDGRALHNLLDRVVTTRAQAMTEIQGATVLAVPLLAGDEPLGAVLLSQPGPARPLDDEVEVVTSLAPQAADAIQRARLYAVSERTVAELSILHDVGRAIAQRRSMPEIFDYIASEVQNLVDYTVGLISLVDREEEYLEIVSIWGNAPEEALGDHVPVDKSIMGSVFRRLEPVVVDDVQTHPRAWAVDRAPWRSLVCVPLMTGAQAIGAMLVGHEQPGMFTREDLRLTSLLGNQAGAAIYHARESDRQRELYRAGVEALAAAVDAKDSYTHSHSRHVAELSRKTAEALGLDIEEVERIELAGLLHDVGKIGIPDHILTKPGRLDPQERLLMISHAALGARIVAAHPALAELTDLVLHHHEWHNGSGYPDGLRGDEIPIGSAIISVADAFDSMTTYRPYRSSLSIEAARDELTRWSGIQFHPRVIEAFLSIIADGDTTLPELPGPTVDMRPIRAADIIAPRVLSQVATEIADLTDLYPFLDRLQQIIRDETKYDEVHLFLAEDGGSELVLAASTLHADMVGRLKLSAGNLLAAEAARTRTLVNSGDIAEDPRAGLIDLESKSGLEVPLIVDGQVIGVLGAASADPQRFEMRDETLMEAIARQIAPTVMVSRLHDITRRTASIDGLTGVMNHRAFYRRLEEMIAALDERDSDLHLLIVDVVGLKAVNDVYGHLAGDRALVAVAHALKSRVRGEDEIARYGGDEFVVIVQGTPRGGLDELARRITAPVEFSLDEGRPMTIRLRCGVATAHSPTERATELVARADAGLYIDIQPTERERE